MFPEFHSAGDCFTLGNCILLQRVERQNTWLSRDLGVEDYFAAQTLKWERCTGKCPKAIASAGWRVVATMRARCLCGDGAPRGMTVVTVAMFGGF